MNYDIVMFLFCTIYPSKHDLNLIIYRFFSHCAFFCQRLLPNLKLMLRPGVAVQEEAMGMDTDTEDTGLDMVIKHTMLLL